MIVLKVIISIEKILFLGKLWQTQKIIRDNLIVKIHMFWEKVFSSSIYSSDFVILENKKRKMKFINYWKRLNEFQRLYML